MLWRNAMSAGIALKSFVGLGWRWFSRHLLYSLHYAQEGDQITLCEALLLCLGQAGESYANQPVHVDQCCSTFLPHEQRPGSAHHLWAGFSSAAWPNSAAWKGKECGFAPIWTREGEGMAWPCLIWLCKGWEFGRGAGVAGQIPWPVGALWAKCYGSAGWNWPMRWGWASLMETTPHLMTNCSVGVSKVLESSAGGWRGNLITQFCQWVPLTLLEEDSG